MAKNNPIRNLEFFISDDDGNFLWSAEYEMRGKKSNADSIEYACRILNAPRNNQLLFELEMTLGHTNLMPDDFNKFVGVSFPGFPGGIYFSDKQWTIHQNAESSQGAVRLKSQIILFPEQVYDKFVKDQYAVRRLERLIASRPVQNSSLFSSPPLLSTSTGKKRNREQDGDEMRKFARQ